MTTTLVRRVHDISDDGIPSGFLPEWKRLKGLSDDDLIREYEDGVTETAAGIIRLALKVRMRELRGVPAPKSPLTDWLRRVAWGQLHPDVVSQLLGRTRLLEKIATLPLPDQIRIMKDGGLQIGRLENGEVNSFLVPFGELTPREIAIAIFDGKYHSAEQQVSFERRRPSALPPHENVPYAISGGVLLVYRPGHPPLRITEKDLERLLKSIRDEKGRRRRKS